MPTKAELEAELEAAKKKLAKVEKVQKELEDRLRAQDDLEEPEKTDGMPPEVRAELANTIAALKKQRSLSGIAAEIEKLESLL